MAVYLELMQNRRDQREVGSRQLNIYGVSCRAKLVTTGPRRKAACRRGQERMCNLYGLVTSQAEIRESFGA